MGDNATAQSVMNDLKFAFRQLLNNLGFKRSGKGLVASGEWKRQAERYE
jgi:hypothetical protein